MGHKYRMRDLMNILTENEHLQTLDTGLRNAVAELLGFIDIEGEDEDIRHCIAILNTAQVSNDFATMGQAGHEVVARLGEWLTDNTEEVFEEMPDVDNARAKLDDLLHDVGA